VGHQTSKARVARRKVLPPAGLKYIYDDELYICDGRVVADNSCTLESGSNDEQCRVTFSVEPALPQGLALDPRTGTISGGIDFDTAPDEERALALKPKRTRYTVTARNVAGTCKTHVSITLMVAPRTLHYAHTDVTFRAGELRMAWSAELLEQARERGWKRNPDPFFPIDLTHAGIAVPDKNPLAASSFLGCAECRRTL
jgi:hypothetical protein